MTTLGITFLNNEALRKNILRGGGEQFPWPKEMERHLLVRVHPRIALQAQPNATACKMYWQGKVVTASSIKFLKSLLNIRNS